MPALLTRASRWPNSSIAGADQRVGDVDVAAVTDSGDGRPAGGRDLLDHRLRGRRVDLADDHGGALPGQLDRLTAADPAAGAGDDRDLVVHQCHGVTFNRSDRRPVRGITFTYAAAMADPRSTDGVDSEVGRLRTVLLHRPGAELARLTPRNSADLLFDGIPWVERAQQEHDQFADALRDHDVEVLNLRDLLTEALAVDAARNQVINRTLSDQRLGDELRRIVAGHLAGLTAGELADVSIAGLTNDELSAGSGVVARLMGPHEFVVPPLPNLLFTRDSSVWVGSQVAVTSPSMPARRRETWLTDAIYRHHPRFAGTPLLYSHDDEWLEGGDVLLLAPGVIAVGVGQRTARRGG